MKQNIQLNEIELDVDKKNINDGTSFHNTKNTEKNVPIESPHISDIEDYHSEKKFQVPASLKKTFICSMVLAGIGIILIILGCIRDVAEADPGKGITFWVLGSIVLIPGGYYSYQFYRAKKAKYSDERDEILEAIPEL